MNKLNDWSNRERYDINLLYESYVEYRLGTMCIDYFLNNINNLVHFVLDVRFASIISLDRDDLVAVSIEGVYDKLMRNTGIFKQPIENIHPFGFSNYMHSIILSSIRGYLASFDLQTAEYPEFEYVCNKCNYLKSMYHRSKIILTIKCPKCDTLMVVGRVLESYYYDTVSSCEHAHDTMNYIRTLTNKLIGFMKSKNRFGILDGIITYYVHSKLSGNIVLAKCLKNTYLSMHSNRDMDNLNFLYNWAIYKIRDDVDYIRYRRFLENAL